MTATHFLLTATEQEIFNKAYLGLKSQGFQKSVDLYSKCLCQGPNGLKCAIGHCGENFVEMGVDAEGFWKSLGIQRDSIDRDRLVFLLELQWAHDRSPRSSIEKEMRGFAKLHQLQVPE